MELVKKESVHYIFHYIKNSCAEKDIYKIIDFQEKCFKHICNSLKVNIGFKINYYLCDSPEELGRIYGDNEPANGFAQMPDKIYAVYNEKVKCIGYHEDVHIISYNTLTRPKQSFIREGLAMFFDRVWWGYPNQAWVKEMIECGVFLKVSNLMNNEEFFKYSEVITYPYAGAFTEFLINIFGIEKYKKLYLNTSENAEASFSSIFGSTLENIENEFTDYVTTVRYDSSIYKTIKEYLKNEGIA